MEEAKLLRANKNLSDKLDKLKGVEFELKLALEKIERLHESLEDMRKSKLKISSIQIARNDVADGPRYVAQIENIHETPNGLLIEARI